MDHQTFDRMTRLFRTSGSRRTAWRALLAGALLGATTRRAAAEPCANGKHLCGNTCCPGKCFTNGPCEVCCTGTNIICHTTGQPVCCLDDGSKDPCSVCLTSGLRWLLPGGHPRQLPPSLAPDRPSREPRGRRAESASDVLSCRLCGCGRTSMRLRGRRYPLARSLWLPSDRCRGTLRICGRRRRPGPAGNAPRRPAGARGRSPPVSGRPSGVA